MSGLGTSSTNVNQQSQTSPWAPSQGGLQQEISNINALMGQTAGGENPASQKLWQGAQKAAGGLPNPGQAFNTAGQGLLSGDPTGILGQIRGSIGNINNPAASPGMQGLLSTIQNDTQNSVNSQFAGAGRSLSGMNQQALARGLAQGEAPTLANQYNANTGTLQNIAGAMTGNTQTGLQDISGAFPASQLPAQTVQSAMNAPGTSAAQMTGLSENLAIPIAGLGGQTQGSLQGTQNASLTSILGSLLGGSGGGIIGNGLGLGSTIGKAIL